MLERFSATVEKIYAAASDRSAWGRALAAVEDLTGSAGAVVHIVPTGEAGEMTSLLGHSAQGYFLADHVDEWTREYASMCPRLAAASRWPDAPYYVDYMLMTEREMDLNPVYEWYGGHGLRYFIGSRLCWDDKVEIVWSLQRRREHGHAEADDVRLFELLKPHLARSLALADQFGTLRCFDRFSAAVLEALPQAVFALDANCTVRFANSRASMLLARGDGLRVDDGRLATELPSDQPLLDSLMLGALSPLPSSCRGWIRIRRSSGQLPLALFAAPLMTEDDELTAMQAKVVVVVHDPGDQRCADADMLMSLYGLTRTEARLASALSGGHSTESAAALLCMQPSTVRSHLKTVFRKTGVNRQQDLVRLLASLPSWLPQG